MRYNKTTLYTITDSRTNQPVVKPGDGLTQWLRGRDMTVLSIRVATKNEAETLWQSPLHSGWTVTNRQTEYWYCRGVEDGSASKARLDFTGDNVPVDWSEGERMAYRDAYTDGYGHGEERAQVEVSNA